MIWKRLLPVIGLLALLNGQTITDFSTAYKHRIDGDASVRSHEHRLEYSQKQIAIAKALEPMELELVTEKLGQEELEFAVSQSFELGSTRKARIQRTRNELKREQASSRIQYQVIHKQLSSLFAEAVFLSKSADLSHKRLETSQQLIDWQEYQLQAGVISETELIRSRLELDQQKMEYNLITQNRDNHLAEICQYLKIDKQNIKLPDEYPALPDGKVIESRLNSVDSNLVRKLQIAELGILRAELKENEPRVVPTLAVTGGVLRTPMDVNPLLGVSLELPLFSRNRDKTEVQQYQLKEGENDLAAVEDELSQAKIEWLHNWTMVSQELNKLNEVLLPGAEDLQDRVWTEYQEAARSYLEVLDARNLLHDMKELELELKHEQVSLLFEFNIIVGEYFYAFK